MMWENPLILPKYQNLYGQGSCDEFDSGNYSFAYVDGMGGGTYDGVDESWGPRLDGRLITQFDSPYDAETGVRTPTPWIAHPDNVKSFFETGLKSTTSVAIAGARQGANFRLSFSNQNIKGVLPNTDLKKNTIALNGELAITDKITVGGSANYISNVSDNIAENGYNGGNPMQSISQWFGRQVDMQVLREKWNTLGGNGLPFNWNSNYHNNPFWTLNKDTNSRNRDRMIGNVNLSWKFTDWLTFRAVAGTDWYVEDIVQRRAVGDVGMGLGPLGAFDSFSNRRQELNANARLEFNKTFGNFNFNGALGTEYNHYNGQYRSTNVSQLIVPDLYSVSNAAVAATTDLSETHTELQSVFGTANFSYKNFIFLDLTGRNDWSSTLPVDNNSYFYPSASLSLVLTDALGIKSNVLSYLKLRGSYAEVGGTAGAYSLQGVYSASDPFIGNPSLGYTGDIPPLGLKPQRKKSKEIGLEAKLFQNRISFDVSLYKENTINQIMNIAVSRTTGFNNKTINAGNLQNMGAEVQILATPVMTKNFSWDIALNWSRNVNKVVELYQDMKYLNLYAAGWNAYVYAFPGKDYGTLWGYSIVREKATPVYYDKAETQLSHILYTGRPVVSTGGRYIRSNARTDLGNIYPDWFGGINNSFTYKNFNFSFLVDFKKGGKVFSVTDMFGKYTGIFDETAAINANGKNVRDALADGGGVLVENAVIGKLKADGTVQFLDAAGANSDTPVENAKYSDANLLYYGYYGKNELSTFDASFVKLREVSAGYSFNKVAFLNKLGVKNLNLSLVGRNLWIIHKNTLDIDPEVSSSAGNTSVGSETNTIPSTRSYGFNIRLDF
jgi:TonB-linked SusC/RagA family outer membrane protein